MIRVISNFVYQVRIFFVQIIKIRIRREDNAYFSGSRLEGVAVT